MFFECCEGKVLLVKDKQNIISAKGTEKTPALKIVVLEDK